MIAWFKVKHDDSAVSLEVAPPGQARWTAQFQWSDIVRVCFEASDLFTSDGIYIFTSARPESYVIPIEAEGGAELWNELIHRQLFDASLAIQAATETETLHCWPEETN